MLRACLVSLPAAPVVETTIPGNIGGTETRAWLFARTLAKRGDTEVTFIVRHREPLPRTTYENVEVRTLVDPLFNLHEQVGMSVERRPGFPWLRIKQWRPSLLWRLPEVAVRRFLDSRNRDPYAADPTYEGVSTDVFCTFGVQTNSAKVIASAHQAGKPAVLVLGSDGDLDERFFTDPDYINPYGDRSPVCRWILREADAIVCQTPDQQRLLQGRFQRSGVVVANPIDLTEWDCRAAEKVVLPVTGDRFVLWVGRAEPEHKRPMMCIEIAAKVPEIPFVMVMNPRDPAEEARVRASVPQNVTIVPSLAPDRMASLMSRALALLNTSALEGFPNTFLQAGAARIPAISLVVGDDFFHASGGGVCTRGDLDAAAKSIRRYASDAALRESVGAKSRSWIAGHHNAATQTAALRDVLRQAVESGVRAGAVDGATSAR